MTNRLLARPTTEPFSDAAQIARIMGLPSWRKMNSLSLVDPIEQGLPMQAVERVERVMAPDDPHAKLTLVSRSNVVPAPEAAATTP